MKKHLTLLILSLSLQIIAFGQTPDTLVCPGEVTFNSGFEKEAFWEYINDKDTNNYFKIFLSLGMDETSETYLKNKNILEQFIKETEQETAQKNNAKKVKYIYNAVHDKFLKKYEPRAFFHDVFKTGYYNCVSASILYGLIFDKLNIPYDVKLSPSHVYLIAYPQTYSIMMETTNPLKGYFVFDENFKLKYVNYLKDSKLISLDEYNNNSTDTLFQKYYFKEKNTSLKALIGIQYMNDGLFKLESQKFSESFFQLEKAYLFYPTKETGYLLFVTEVSALNKTNISDPMRLDFIYKLARFKNYGIGKDEIVGEYSNVALNLLLNEGDGKMYDSAYYKLSDKIKDAAIKTEIDFIYNYEKARNYVKLAMYNESYEYGEKAYRIRPNNTDAQSIFMVGVSAKLSRIGSFKEQLEFMDQLATRYQSLNESVMFMHLKLEKYLMNAMFSFNNKDAEEAFKSLVFFTINYKKDLSNYTLDDLIEKAFSAGSFYYYRKGHYDKAKNMILKGLEYVPNSIDLKTKLNAINN